MLLISYKLVKSLSDNNSKKKSKQEICLYGWKYAGICSIQALGSSTNSSSPCQAFLFASPLGSGAGQARAEKICSACPGLRWWQRSRRCQGWFRTRLACRWTASSASSWRGWKIRGWVDLCNSAPIATFRWLKQLLSNEFCYFQLGTKEQMDAFQTSSCILQLWLMSQIFSIMTNNVMTDIFQG